MKFTNYESQYAHDMNMYVNSMDKIALRSVFSTELLDGYTHDNDNGFVDTSYGKTIHQLRLRGCQILGTARAPWAHRGDDLAVIYEDADTYEKYWCHINERILNWWIEQADMV